MVANTNVPLNTDGNLPLNTDGNLPLNTDGNLPLNTDKKLPVNTELKSQWKIVNFFSSLFNPSGKQNTDNKPEKTGSVPKPTPSQIIDEIIDKGVAHYSLCAGTDVYKGLSEDGFKQYMELSLQEHDIPSDYKDKYLQYYKNVIKDECRNVHGRNIMFNNGSGSYTSVRFMCFRDESNDFSLFVTSLQISCELSDEIFAYEDYVSHDLLTLPNVDRDQIKIDNLQTTSNSILSKEEFERIFVFLGDVTHRQMSTELSIKAAPNN